MSAVGVPLHIPHITSTAVRDTKIQIWKVTKNPIILMLKSQIPKLLEL